VVQIAAIKVDASDGYRELASWSALVKPRKNPKLSAYFVKLTEITQEQVDNEGVDFTEALSGRG
jgi:inhibitor of KinA sporulation pathway (predicted exonuclease)